MEERFAVVEGRMEFLTEAAALARAGRISKHGIPKGIAGWLQGAVMIERYRAMVVMGFPPLPRPRSSASSSHPSPASAGTAVTGRGSWAERSSGMREVIGDNRTVQDHATTAAAEGRSATAARAARCG